MSNSVCWPLWHTRAFACCLSSLPRCKLDEGKTSISLLIFLLYCIAYTVSGVSTNICQRKEGRREGSEGQRGLYTHLVGLHAFCFSLLPSLPPLACSEPQLSPDSKPPCPRPAPSRSSTHNATEYLFKTQELLPVKPPLNVQKKIFAKHIPDKGCMPGIYKGLSKLNRTK